MRFIILFLFLASSLFGKVYDCFLYFNEWEILEIRLHELYDHVDHFVLVEAIETHKTGEVKPFYFDEVKEKFAPFMDKIIHVQLHERIVTSNPWTRENWQRDQIMRGLTSCQNDDLILISDVDEFIPGEKVKEVIDLTARKAIGFTQQMYRWYLNRSVSLWNGTVALRYKDLRKIGPELARSNCRNNRVRLYPYGWHFTSMGGYEKAEAKYNSIVEGYQGDFSRETFRSIVEALPLVPIDETYPQFVQENIPYLKTIHMIDEECAN